MAVKRQVVETYLSDLSGEETENIINVAFTFDGKRYKLDLTPSEAAEFEGVMARYVNAAEEAKKSNGGNSSGDESQAIRQWGRDHGYDVQERGKLSAALQAAYYKAQSEAGNGQDVDTEKSGTRTKK